MHCIAVLKVAAPPSAPMQLLPLFTECGVGFYVPCDPLPGIKEQIGGQLEAMDAVLDALAALGIQCCLFAGPVDLTNADVPTLFIDPDYQASQTH